MDKRVLFKLDEDDILELVTEHIAEERNFGTYRFKSMIFGTPGKDLRLVAVIGELEDDSIKDLDLQIIDGKIDYNGSHSNVRYLDLEEFKKIDFKNLKEV